MVSIIFSLLLSSAIAAPENNWETLADRLMSEEVDMTGAKTQLLGLPQLDDKLKEGLEAGGLSERRALFVVRNLPRPSLIPTLLEKIRPFEIAGVKAENYFVTLIGMAGGVNGDQIVSELRKKIDITSPRVSPAIRIALLSGMALRSSAPEISVLSKLLDDPSYELRMKAMEVSSLSSGSQEEFLKKAMTVSPYAVRLRAVDVISSFPAMKRQGFKTQVEKCARVDENEVVKKACGAVKF